MAATWFFVQCFYLSNLSRLCQSTVGFSPPNNHYILFYIFCCCRPSCANVWSYIISPSSLLSTSPSFSYSWLPTISLSICYHLFWQHAWPCFDCWFFSKCLHFLSGVWWQCILFCRAVWCLPFSVPLLSGWIVVCLYSVCALKYSNLYFVNLYWLQVTCNENKKQYKEVQSGPDRSPVMMPKWVKTKNIHSKNKLIKEQSRTKNILEKNEGGSQNGLFNIVVQ